MCMSGVDYALEEVTVTIGPPVGSGSPDLMDFTMVCIDIDTATDTDIEGAESLTVMGTVINNADLAEFPDGDTVSITILDTSGEWWIDASSSGFVCRGIILGNVRVLSL